MEEQWIVKNNTKSVLMLPENGLRFNFFGQEKELCFFTNKTINELERDQEIIVNLAHNNIVTVSKTTKEEKKENELKNQIQELKDLIISNKQTVVQQQNVDVSEIVKAINENINVKVSGQNYQEKIVLFNEDEKMQEDVIRQLVMQKKDTSEKHISGLGKESKVENESEGNEDLLSDLDI